jgi:hypothetical protein
MIPKTVEVRFEQAVYGSFPFWDRGYAILAHSAGCRPEWLAALKLACQRYGERPVGTAEAGGFFAMRLDRGPWMIVGVTPHGRDDQGRPGALAFHALFVSRWTYWRTGADPFAFAEALGSQWSRADLDATLPLGRRTIRRARFWPTVRQPAVEEDHRLCSIVAALVQGRRVLVKSTEPIATLARAVWQALPMHVRLRASVATWAFDNANRFDLVALPKLAGITRSASDLILMGEDDDRSEQ